MNCAFVLYVNLPEDFLVVSVERVKVRISRNNSTNVSPCTRVVDQRFAEWVLKDIPTHPFKTISTPFVIFQHVIEGLGLKLAWRERRFKVRPQECHRIALIGVICQAHPNQMHVIGHQTIYMGQNRFSRAATCNINSRKRA